MDQNNIACLLYLLLFTLFLRYSLHMKDAILEGGNQFEKVHGMSIFQYMDKDPTFNIVFKVKMGFYPFFINFLVKCSVSKII